MLERKVHYQAWTYRFYNRTTTYGVVIAILGGVIVLARTVLKIWTGAKEVSAMELLVAALRHVPEEEEKLQLENLGENDVARLRWRGVRSGSDGTAEEEANHEGGGPKSEMNFEEVES